MLWGLGCQKQGTKGGPRLGLKYLVCPGGRFGQSICNLWTWPALACRKSAACLGTKAVEMATGFWDSHLRTQRWQMSHLNSGIVGGRGDASRARMWAPASPWPAVPCQRLQKKSHEVYLLLTLGWGSDDSTCLLLAVHHGADERGRCIKRE